MVKKIVLTGGPCGGKSTMLEKLKDRYSQEAVFVEEVATHLLSRDWKVPEKWSAQWQDDFEGAVIEKQLEFEAKSLEKAQKEKKRLIILDRGLLDAVAYLSGGIDDFIQKFGIGRLEALDRYEGVIHLESLATWHPKLHKELIKSNPMRFESVKRAVELEKKHQLAWNNHKKRLHLAEDLKKGFDEVVTFIEKVKEEEQRSKGVGVKK